MNIFHVLDERWDSAITAYGLSSAKALKSRGHVVCIGARSGSPAFDGAEKLGISTFALGTVWAFRRHLRRGGFQIVNSHTGTGHFRSWLGALGRSIALVRTRGDAREVGASRGRSLLYGRTDAVIGASRCIAEQYSSSFPSLQGRVSVVYPGLEIPAFEAEPVGSVRIALIGRLDPVKGHEDFLAAIRCIKTSLTTEEFVIAGEEKNLTAAELIHTAEKYGVSRWVRFLSRIEDMPSFMRGCHAGVVASIGSEALSRVCLEWMAQGRPVVATAVGCLPELVSTGENGFLVSPRNAQALANCLLGLIRHPELRRQMGNRAHEIASKRFSLSRLGVETEKVYEEALRRRAVQGAKR